MKREDMQQWNADTMAMILDPKRGDHFTEMMGSVALVTHRFGRRVAVRVAEVKGNEKVWSRQRLLTLKEFRDLLTYSTDRNKASGEGWRDGIYPRWKATTLTPLSETG